MTDRREEPKSGFPENETESSNLYYKEQKQMKRKKDKDSATEQSSPSHIHDVPQTKTKKRKTHREENKVKEQHQQQPRRSPRKQQQQNPIINLSSKALSTTTALINSSKSLTSTLPQDSSLHQKFDSTLKQNQNINTTASDTESHLTLSSFQIKSNSSIEPIKPHEGSNIQPVAECLQKTDVSHQNTTTPLQISDFHDDEEKKLQEMKEKRDVFWKEDELTPNTIHRLEEHSNSKEDCETVTHIMNLLHDNESTPERKDSHTLSTFLQLSVVESSTTTDISCPQNKQQKEIKLVKNLQLITLEAEKSLSLSTSLNDTKETVTQSQNQLASSTEGRDSKQEIQPKNDNDDDEDFWRSLSKEDMEKLDAVDNLPKFADNSASITTKITTDFPSEHTGSLEISSGHHLKEKQQALSLSSQISSTQLSRKSTMEANQFLQSRPISSSQVQNNPQPYPQTFSTSEQPKVPLQQQTVDAQLIYSSFRTSPLITSNLSRSAPQSQKYKESTCTFSSSAPSRILKSSDEGDPLPSDDLTDEDILLLSVQLPTGNTNKHTSSQTKNQDLKTSIKPTTEINVTSPVTSEKTTLLADTTTTHSTKSSSISSRYRRLIVLDVEDTLTEKKLRMYDEKDPTAEPYIILRDDWKTTPVYSGDTVNIVGRPEPKSELNPVELYVVSNHQNVLILHPDVLVTGSSLCKSLQCFRLAVIDAKVKSRLESPQALYGKLNHEIFQKGISSGDFTSKTLEKYIDDLILASIESIYATGTSEIEVRKHLYRILPSIQEWAQRYFNQHLDSNSKCSVEFIPSELKQKYKVCVKKALKTEENIWSLMYGTKGNIDVSVEVILQFQQEHQKIEKTLWVPLELKSGKLFPSHGAQVVLYALLMMDRYNMKIPVGFLVSLDQRRMLGISVTRDHVQQILIKRNQLAHYLTSPKLPPMLREEHICSSCYALDTCIIYHKALENGTQESSRLRDFAEKTQHLTTSHCDFLKHWEKLLDLEAQEIFKVNKEIWSMDSAQREKLGRCLSQMVIESVEKTPTETYFYQFKKASGNTSQSSMLNLLDIQINTGDQVVLSIEQNNVSVATGTVIEITPTSITIELTSELQAPFHPGGGGGVTIPSSQRFRGLTDIEDLPIISSAFGDNLQELNRGGLDRDLRWRIDKDELTSAFCYARANLLKLFLPKNGDERRRRLIVDLERPSFTSESIERYSQLLRQSRCKFDENLNPDQERAVLKVLSAQDYALILGMPGTGKTTTIAHVVNLLVSLGKSVLISAYTHSAVDNLLLKLKAIGIPFLRLGSKHQVHPELHQYIFNFDGSIRTVEDIEKKYSQIKVVALTCMSVGHVLLQRQKFDYCIVDEASQLTLPICLGPISLCNIFILVGDIYQLPPLVRRNEAKQKGLDVSLFKYLSEAHPQAIVTLEYQYRMNEDIMTLSNTLIYHNRLRCGTPQVANSYLEVPHLDKLPRLIDEHLNQKHDWIREVLLPIRRVVFLDTDQIPAPEIQIGDLVKNIVEASLVAMLTEALVGTGVSPHAIGIISPWRSQLKEIHQQLSRHSLVGIEVHTVDKYQGRDKDCIIISLVRNNAKRNVGNLLRDWHRVNVAFTRAKKKLIIFGSRSTLQGNHLFQSFFDLIDQREWCYSLPQRADKLYRRREHYQISNVQSQAQPDHRLSPFPPPMT